MKARTKKQPHRWSAKVTEHSNAMDLDKDVFKSKDPDKIARSLKHSAEESNRRKASPFQSAMSMLNFYENRAGKNLTKSQRAPLEKAKNKLRKLFGRPEK
ncbi:DUF3175 domain-containing protein [Mucilaginibacter boryungensis]|uniref:DUF3175 domain-containing protein n=1 Tax=Mucilaginibacter boryungensis TaxID=768480 RepID=A0ABR9XJJ2_9SPHI|nr:DUF3175 domain-containing protein [Mucilaginibacter boryungensis]MBE9667357.1 DUF3175 domain-containing protein [Mucilaginibacter boryungensis]